MSGYFQPWYTVFIVSISFVCLVKDYVQSDLLFCAALALLITGKVITVEEGIQGFANEGLLTVAALFVVAQGISSTGGLDWYMGRFLGKPKTIASAQIRLMFPIAIISAFLNNTPVVAVMIPIVQRWAENNGMSKKQVLMPLSFASILGGTCTLIGTSTNLVVTGMLETWAKENKEKIGADKVDIGLFDLGKYGVPVAFSGIVYVIIFSKYLLPGGNLQRGRRNGSSSQNRAAEDDDNEDIIVGAKVMPWSDAVGRTIEASGLRGLPGLYLVSVRRSGSLIRAVGPEFIINQGDILYFTGLIESLGSISSEHGLTAITHEDDDHDEPPSSEVTTIRENVARASSSEAMREILDLQTLARSQAIDGRDKAEHLYRDRRDTSDAIGGDEVSVSSAEMNITLGPALVSVEKDPDASEGDQARMVLGISATDRPGLLHDISKSLNRLKVQCLHSEASAVGGRSISIWRIVALDPETKREEIRAVVQAMLAPTTGSGAQKERGQMVMRCKVKVGSTLVHKFVKDVDFRATYGGAIVAVQRNGRAPSGKLRNVRLEANDNLVVQVRPDSPLVTLQQIARNAALKAKQENESGRGEGRGSGSNSRRSSHDNLLSSSGRNRSLSVLPTTTAVLDVERGNDEDAEYNEALRNEITAVANMEINEEDLTGLDRCKVDFDIPWEDIMQLGDDAKEFLIGVKIENTARQFIGKSAIEAGLRTLPKLFLVSIERGVYDANNMLQEELTIDVTEPLAPGDILWYAGEAVAVSSLRKIPGLTTLGSDQASKLSSSNQDRRLVQAVIAKNGPLVGKSIRDMKFRTRYNAVVLAVHREGARVHAKMGEVVLHAGDVLLLDAGPDLVREGFALVSILEDSAPPRLSLLVPAISCAVAMIVLYTFGVMSLLVAAILAAGVMIASGAMSQQEARDAIKWDVIVTIAAAFGLSKALQNSGVASFMAEQLVKLGTATNTGEIGLFVGAYLATFLISNVVTNNAAAALMFPIVAEAAVEANISLLKMSYLLMLGASASFMSPFGYQTNLMVYGPGGYVFKDFLTFGFPMQLVQLIVSVAVIAADELWWLLWLVLGGVLLVVCVAKVYGFENTISKVKIWKKNS